MAASATRLSIVFACVAFSTAAHARIVCKDGFQMNASGPISTPYCRDEQLAEVARAHGMTVAAKEIRQNPNFKDSVCRLVGYDIRVRDHCNTDSNSSRDD